MPELNIAAPEIPELEAEAELPCRPPQRVLVCGGRDYADRRRLYAELDALRETVEITQIIEGEASGADSLARQWGESRGIPVRKFPANWRRYGKRAGYLRNKQMLNEGKPHLVVAFPGGKGTDGMVMISRQAGVPVKRIS